MDQLTLGKKKVKFEPMTWGKQKEVILLIGEGLAQIAEAKAKGSSLLMQMIRGEKAETAGVLDILRSFPELVTKVLALGLGVTEQDLNAATGLQFMAALEVFSKENALAEQFERGKNVYSRLTLKTAPGVENNQPGNKKPTSGRS